MQATAAALRAAGFSIGTTIRQSPQHIGFWLADPNLPNLQSRHRLAAIALISTSHRMAETALTIHRAEAAEPAWRARARPLLGTLVEISAPAGNDAELRAWTEPAFDRIASLHAAMSFHSTTSDLAAIARAPADTQLVVQADTWQTLALALELEAASGGAFNCAVAPVLVQRGLLPRPAGAVWPSATSATAAITLLDGNRLRIEQAVWIDLGGVAKGVAVDAAVQALRAAGAPAGLVNAGGDLRVFGEHARRVVLRHPRCPQRFISAALLSEGAVATSAAYFERSPAGDDVSAGDAIDDRAALVTPQCWQQGAASLPAHAAVPASVSVFAPSCAVADGLTKVLALVTAASAPLLRRYAARGLWIDRDGLAHPV